MTLLDLLAQFRSDAKDTVATYLFGDLEVIGWLGEAEEEACIRARLLFDDATAALCEIAVTAGTREYAIDPRITEIVTAWLTDAYSMEYDLDIVMRTWLDRQDPDWRKDAARRPEALMHLSKRIAFEVDPDADYTLTQEVYRKPLVSLSVRQSVTLQDTGDTVTHTAHGHLDGEAVLFAAIDQTTGIETEAVYYLRDVEADTYKLAASPGGAALVLTTDGTGSVVYLDAEPEIEDAHHRHLVDWAMYRAFGIPDADTYDKTLSGEAMGRFEAHFGPHPGADMRRTHNARKPRARPVWC